VRRAFCLPSSIRFTISRSDVCRRDVSSAADWVTILRLATRWHFASFRTLAFQTLDPIASPLQKLFLARELDIPDWLLPAHVALCLREEPLSLSEMRLLPLEDIHTIFTVHELVKTARVAATVEDVSRHIQPLIVASVEVFTPTSDTDIMATSLSEHRSASRLSPSPASPSIAPIVVVAEATFETDHFPAELGFDPLAMRKALEEAAYDRAVASISPANGEEASWVLVEWATDCCQAWPSGTYPLQDLVYAFAHRCARDVSFFGTAADVLAAFCESAEGPQGMQYPTTSGSYTRLGDCLLQEFCQVATLVLGVSSWDSHLAPSSGMRMVLYGPTWRSLTHNDFASRLHNCTAFIGESLKAGLVADSFVINAIETLNAKSLYSRLLALGYYLDSAGSGLDTLLKKLDDMCQWSAFIREAPKSESFLEHCKWMLVCILLPLCQGLPMPC
jgi:hypothetical protein